MRRFARFVLRRPARPPEPLPDGPVKVVVFDFDGTLADTMQAGWEILNGMAAEFKYRRLEEADLEHARDLTTRQLMRFLNIPTRKLPTISRKGVRALREKIHLIQPLPGIPEMVRELQATGVRLGIITSNSEENVGVFVKNHGLEVFEFVRSSSRLMGKAREIRLAMKMYHFGAADVLYVGDETRDIEACRRVGIRCAAVSWGYNSRRSLEAQKPHCVLDRPEELVEFVRERVVGS